MVIAHQLLSLSEIISIPLIVLTQLTIMNDDNATGNKWYTLYTLHDMSYNIILYRSTTTTTEVLSTTTTTEVLQLLH